MSLEITFHSQFIAPSFAASHRIRKAGYLQELQTVEQVPELFSAGGKRPPESVVRQSEVLQHSEVEEDGVESLEVVVAEVELVERLVQCVERSWRY